MPVNDKMTIHDKTVLQYLDRVGYSSPIVLEAKFCIHRNTLGNVLSRLWHGGHIDRPLKGFIVSTHWKEKHPHEAMKIESHLGIHIPSKQTLKGMKDHE